MALPAGLLRYRVTIQSATHTSNFENTPTWTDGATFWSAVSYNTTAEKAQQGVVQCFTTATFSTHHRTDITHKDKLKLGDRIFNVLGVTNVPEENETTITAIEVV